MEMRKGNTAVMNVMWLTDSEVKAMNKKQFENEANYQVIMSFAKKFLNDGTITEENYRDFDTKMRQKYRPTFGTLFTDIDLDKSLI
jgi:hypothetical protein